MIKYYDITQVKKDIEYKIKENEEDLGYLKKIKRVKTKKGEDFKILSKNFTDCWLERYYGWKVLRFPGGISIGIYNEKKETADYVEAEINRLIEMCENDIKAYKKDLELAEEYFEKYKEIKMKYEEQVEELDEELRTINPYGMLSDKCKVYNRITDY